MEGFSSDEKSRAITLIGYKDIKSVDEIARQALESLVDIDEQQATLKVGLKGIIEYERKSVKDNYSEGRHLATLRKVLEKRYISEVVPPKGYFIIAIDEADKCPILFAQFFRALVTHAQQSGLKNLRFAFAGVSPFMRQMVDEDNGIIRFVYKTISLDSFTEDESADLLHAKFSLVVQSSEEFGEKLAVHPDVITRIANLSGGHPHLLQLLGSHVVEHEVQDPDGIIDERDLKGSLISICYDERGWVYNSILQFMEEEAKLDAFYELLGSMRRGFPTTIPRGAAYQLLNREEMDWFLRNNIITERGDHYALVDEFLKVRCYLDSDRAEAYDNQYDLEKSILRIEDIRSYRGRSIYYLGEDELDEDPYF